MKRRESLCSQSTWRSPDCSEIGGGHFVYDEYSATLSRSFLTLGTARCCHVFAKPPPGTSRKNTSAITTRKLRNHERRDQLKFRQLKTQICKGRVGRTESQKFSTRLIVCLGIIQDSNHAESLYTPTNDRLGLTKSRTAVNLKTATEQSRSISPYATRLA